MARVGALHRYFIAQTPAFELCRVFRAREGGVYAMPTPVWILHQPTRPMMLVDARFHGSDPRFLALACQSIGDA